MGTLSTTKEHVLQGAKDEFFRRFGRKGDVVVVRSPGRINLIGEHTDYNDGFVLPGAVNRSLNFVISKRNDTKCRLYAADLGAGFDFDVARPVRSTRRWANYLIGVVDQFRRSGYKVDGFDCRFGGDIPIGAGLSSSAAIEAGLAFALNEVFGLGVDRVRLAKVAQKSEHEFVGVMCGIMDQFANLLARKDSVFKLDCRTLEYEYIPFSSERYCIALCDTGVKHELANSEYNRRRQQCESSVNKIASLGYPVFKLRDVSFDMLENCRAELDPDDYEKCRYVLEENVRVDSACDALKKCEYKKLGLLLYASHEGLRSKYKVSCEELDYLVETASHIEGVLGARMMGAGFGGCTINLVEKDAMRDFQARIKSEYERKTGEVPKVYECKLVAGSEVVPV
jgi:galactokinase